MRIIVHLHTILQKSTSKGLIRKLEVELETGATLNDLIEYLNLEVDEDDTLFVVQGQIVEREQGLSEGDEVHFIPAISGGGNSGITSGLKYTL